MCLHVFVLCAGLQPAQPSALRLQSLSAAWNTKEMDPESQSNSYCNTDFVFHLSLVETVKLVCACVRDLYCMYTCSGVCISRVTLLLWKELHFG